MGDVVLAAVAAVFASSGFWAFAVAVYNSRKARESAEDRAIRALLHDRVFDISMGLISRGSVTAEEYDNLKYLYDPYVELGGNGTCQRLKTEVDKLPITE
jgi:hypothetical protein